MTSLTQVHPEFKLKIKLPGIESMKWENAGLDSHLQASHLSGLIDKFKGASTYLNDSASSTQLTQVVVCRVKVRKEWLDMGTILEQHMASVEKSDHIHVVTGIIYGVEAYCVLTKDLGQEADENNREEAQEKLSVWATKLQEALEEGKNVTELKEEMDEEDRQQLIRVKCRVYIDIQTPSFRQCSFFDAYKLCLKLIEQIKDTAMTKSKAIPIVYQLCPLKLLNDSHSNPIHYPEIEEDLLARCCRSWMHLENVRTRVEIVKNSTKRISRNSLKDFASAIARYQELLKKAFQKGVIHARYNPNGNNQTLEQILDTVESHALFKVDRLERWLDLKLSEEEVLVKLSQLDGIQFIKSLGLLAKESARSFEKKYSLVLTLPALCKETDKVVLDMNEYFSYYLTLVPSEADEDADDEEDNHLPWYKNVHKSKQVMNKVREFSNYVAQINRVQNDIQFYIILNEEINLCRYSVFQDDLLAKDDTQLPIPPTNLQVSLAPSTGRTNKIKNVLPLKVEWGYKDLGYPHSFIVEYRSKESGIDSSWSQMRTDNSNQTTMTLNCKRDSILEVRVAAETCIGRSSFSTTIDTEFVLEDEEEEEEEAGQSSRMNQQSRISTLKSAPRHVNTSSTEDASSSSEKSALEAPIDLEVDLVTQTTAEIKWSLPANFQDGTKNYCVRYWKEDEQESAALELDVGLKNSCCLEKLTPDTTFLVQIVVVAQDGRRSQPSKTVKATTIRHEIRFAQSFVNQCKKTGVRNGMDLYLVPLTKSSISNGKANRLVFGREEKKNDRHQRRTILVVGATGAGKTTLINAMINYVFNVEWDDPFRFQLIEEGEGRSQAESQTGLITAYDIGHTEGFRIPYSLTIVDTPGYGDTRGLDRDQEITEMVRQFFADKKGIQELDVVGFVAQASLARLSPTQSYIFDSVLSIFGNDIKENIDFLLTFADSQLPPILSAISAASLPCPTDPDTGAPVYHKFNNSGFFCSNRETKNGPATTIERFNQFFWKIGMENFHKFFNMLATMKTKSLSLTQQVLEERKKLEATVEGLQPLIKLGLAKMEEMRKTKLIITNSQFQIEINENVEFEVEVTVPEKVEIPNGQCITNCNKCYVTCHNPCGLSPDADKVNCAAMDSSMEPEFRRCRVCPEKCIWNMHANQPYKWEYVTQKQATSSDAIKHKYENELKRKLTAEELINVLQNDIDQNESAVLKRVDTVARCIQRLDEIALRPNPFSTIQYIDLIIDAEQQEKRTGFKERIASLQKLREMAAITTSVKNKESLFHLNPDCYSPSF